MVNHITTMLDDLNNLIDDFERVVCLDISEFLKRERFMEAEIKLCALLGNFSKAIYDYVGDIFNDQFIEDKVLTKLVIGFMDSLKRVDIHNVDIIQYYSFYMIPFYKGYQKIAVESLIQNSKSLLLQAGEWTLALKLRSILVLKILKYKNKDYF